MRAVKGCLRSTHGGLDDIKLEKEVGGLSVGSDLTTSTAIDDEDAMHTLHKIVAINSRAQVG